MILLLALLLSSPAHALSHLVESGMAGMLTEGKPARRMVSGRAFDPREKVCAHRMHALGTQLVLKAHGRSSSCVVADRGPYASGSSRILDVSKAVAEELGVTAPGSVFMVRIEVRKLATH